ncbi:beta-ketoacyl-ACP synthase II [Sphingobacterium sp. 2149]|uniref:beta-ketoacyl-ACP synthase II n=1 Tax=Sphingobacterium sp. 2149 TaxID=2817763 RepID=UPI0028598722|nr:beta-ketoacyl-ACP synthase II [Sphingobacterium sp. 2149]MDR6736996.1 3-oxoacyl-[acyl-carrier-protein] synthase II [Sphingobacterium sp. 2149]
MKRVVVTGMGTINPLGENIDTFWNNILRGENRTAAISRFDASLFRTQIASEIKQFQPEKYLDRNEIKRSDLFTQYALYSAAQALEDSGLVPESMDPFEIGVIWGVGQGGMETFEKEVEGYVTGDYKPRFSPFFVPRLIVNMASGMISMKYGLKGINYTTVSACATSNTAFMDAFNYIRLGKAKVFISGGSEAPITPASVGGFSAMKAMSSRHDSPQTASRPFDRDRDGFVMGEGAGALILEEYEHAKQRGAKIYAELVGASMTADAYHMTSPHPEGIAAAKAMSLALEEAKINISELDYLNLHATSTPVGDIAELKAMQRAFGNSNNLWVSSTKSMTGHLLGAAGAIEAIIAVKSINNNVIPATINIENIDPEIPEGVNIVINQPLEKTVTAAMSNAFGFGGHNSSIVFKKI